MIFYSYVNVYQRVVLSIDLPPEWIILKSTLALPMFSTWWSPGGFATYRFSYRFLSTKSSKHVLFTLQFWLGPYIYIYTYDIIYIYTQYINSHSIPIVFPWYFSPRGWSCEGTAAARGLWGAWAAAVERWRCPKSWGYHQLLSIICHVLNHFHFFCNFKNHFNVLFVIV